VEKVYTSSITSSRWKLHTVDAMLMQCGDNEVF